MQESQTRTSFKQRVIIGLIAALLLFTFVGVYILVVTQGDGSSKGPNVDEAKVNQLMAAYNDAQEAVDAEAANWSNTYFDEFVGYKDRVVAFNSESVNSGDLTTEDLKVGDGAEITDDTEYWAYYVGWCANGEILDSSFNDASDPTALKAPLEASSMSLIDGWTEGVQGMKIGGVRLISMPSSLAYADQEVEACGGSNAPLKFIVMPVAPAEPMTSLLATLDDTYNEYYVYSNTGLTYDEYLQQLTTGE